MGAYLKLCNWSTHNHTMSFAVCQENVALLVSSQCKSLSNAFRKYLHNANKNVVEPVREFSDFIENMQLNC